MNQPQNPMMPDDTLGADFPVLRANFENRVQRRLDLQTLEWLYWIPMRVLVPAEAGFDTQIDIKSDAHFQCHYITGDYTTISDDVDQGTNLCTVRISDGSNDLKLMNSAVPLDLMLSPGRVRFPGVAGDPSGQLFYPFPFFHTFGANGAILAEFQNSGLTANKVNLLFVGKKLRARK